MGGMQGRRSYVQDDEVARLFQKGAIVSWVSKLKTWLENLRAGPEEAKAEASSLRALMGNQLQTIV